MDENNVFNPEFTPAPEQEAPVAEPVQAPVEPVQQPVYIDEPAQPVYIDEPAQPVYADPAYQQPAQPVYADPAYQQPAQPVYADPAYQQPAQPVYGDPAYAQYQQGALPPSPKSRKVALILAILLGEYGVNMLYLGLGSKRLVMGIIGTFFWPLMIPCVIGAIKDIIATAKGTMVDGQGLPVVNW